MPDTFATGPFSGLQGGGVAGLLCAPIEKNATAEDLGVPASVVTNFVRPAPRSAIQVSVQVLKRGQRVSLLQADAFSEDKMIATQRVTFMRPISLSFQLEPYGGQTANPATLPERPHDRIHKAEWMWTAMDVRQDSGEQVWFRLKRPVCPDATPYSSALPAADWAHGLTSPVGTIDRPMAMRPNTDVMVHFIRAPQGSWIGLHPETLWGLSGAGMGYAALCDTTGVFGRVSMSVAVTPMESTEARTAFATAFA